MVSVISLAIAGFLPLVAGHVALWHPAMWGFNVTAETFPYDNRPVCPLADMTFNQWWFHNFLDYPPLDGDIFGLPAGQAATAELGCNKGATTWFNSSEGGDIREPNNPNDVCPGSDMSEYHTTGFDDLTGCALAITYKDNVTDVQPEDFTVFSVNHTCVWTRFTDFQVPDRMPPCPPGGCICAWFWIHSPDSGGEQNYMNGFRCNVTDSTSTVALAAPQVPRRCGADPQNGKADAVPGNCTYGAKQPFYWFQAERNNMFEDTYGPPFYTDLYNFLDGAQDDIFQDSYVLPMPVPNLDQTELPVLADASASLSASVSATLSPPAPTSASTATAIINPFSSSTAGAKICKRSLSTNSTTAKAKRHSRLRRSLRHLEFVGHARKLWTGRQSRSRKIL